MFWPQVEEQSPRPHEVVVWRLRGDQIEGDDFCQGADIPNGIQPNIGREDVDRHDLAVSGNEAPNHDFGMSLVFTTEGTDNLSSKSQHYFWVLWASSTVKMEHLDDTRTDFSNSQFLVWSSSLGGCGTFPWIGCDSHILLAYTANRPLAHDLPGRVHGHWHSRVGLKRPTQDGQDDGGS